MNPQARQWSYLATKAIDARNYERKSRKKTETGPLSTELGAATTAAEHRSNWRKQNGISSASLLQRQAKARNELRLALAPARLSVSTMARMRQRVVSGYLWGHARDATIGPVYSRGDVVVDRIIEIEQGMAKEGSIEAGA